MVGLQYLCRRGKRGGERDRIEDVTSETAVGDLDGKLCRGRTTLSRGNRPNKLNHLLASLCAWNVSCQDQVRDASSRSPCRSSLTEGWCSRRRRRRRRSRPKNRRKKGTPRTCPLGKTSAGGGSRRREPDSLQRWAVGYRPGLFEEGKAACYVKGSMRTEKKGQSYIGAWGNERDRKVTRARQTRHGRATSVSRKDGGDCHHRTQVADTTIRIFLDPRAELTCNRGARMLTRYPVVGAPAALTQCQHNAGVTREQSAPSHRSPDVPWSLPGAPSPGREQLRRKRS